MTFVHAAKVREAARRFRREDSERALQHQIAQIRECIADGMTKGASAIAIRQKLLPEVVTALQEAGYDVEFTEPFETTITWET